MALGRRGSRVVGRRRRPSATHTRTAANGPLIERRRLWLLSAGLCASSPESDQSARPDRPERKRVAAGRREGNACELSAGIARLRRQSRRRGGISVCACRVSGTHPSTPHNSVLAAEFSLAAAAASVCLSRCRLAEGANLTSRRAGSLEVVVSQSDILSHSAQSSPSHLGRPTAKVRWLACCWPVRRSDIKQQRRYGTAALVCV
jgi:hypothetical protein